MAQDVCEGDGDEHGEQDGVDGGSLGAGHVEEEGEEADADVEDFAGDFVFVDLEVMLVLTEEYVWYFCDIQMIAILDGWESSLVDLGSCSFLASNFCWLALGLSARLMCHLVSTRGSSSGRLAAFCRSSRSFFACDRPHHFAVWGSGS